MKENPSFSLLLSIVGVLFLVGSLITCSEAESEADSTPPEEVIETVTVDRLTLEVMLPYVSVSIPDAEPDYPGLIVANLSTHSINDLQDILSIKAHQNASLTVIFSNSTSTNSQTISVTNPTEVELNLPAGSTNAVTVTATLPNATPPLKRVSFTLAVHRNSQNVQLSLVDDTGNPNDKHTTKSRIRLTAPSNPSITINSVTLTVTTNGTNHPLNPNVFDFTSNTSHFLNLALPLPSDDQASSRSQSDRNRVVVRATSRLGSGITNIASPLEFFLVSGKPTTLPTLSLAEDTGTIGDKVTTNADLSLEWNPSPNTSDSFVLEIVTKQAVPDPIDSSITTITTNTFSLSSDPSNLALSTYAPSLVPPDPQNSDERVVEFTITPIGTSYGHEQRGTPLIFTYVNETLDIEVSLAENTGTPDDLVTTNDEIHLRSSFSGSLALEVTVTTNGNPHVLSEAITALGSNLDLNLISPRSGETPLQVHVRYEATAGAKETFGTFVFQFVAPLTSPVISLYGVSSTEGANPLTDTPRINLGWEDRTKDATFTLAITTNGVTHTPVPAITDLGENLFIGLDDLNPSDPIDVVITATSTDDYGHSQTGPPFEFRFTENINAFTILLRKDTGTHGDKKTLEDRIDILWGEKPSNASFTLAITTNDVSHSNAISTLGFNLDLGIPLPEATPITVVITPTLINDTNKPTETTEETAFTFTLVPPILSQPSLTLTEDTGFSNDSITTIDNLNIAWDDQQPNATFSLAITVDDVPYSPPNPIVDVGTNIDLNLPTTNEPIEIKITPTVSLHGHEKTFAPFTFVLRAPLSSPTLTLAGNDPEKHLSNYTESDRIHLEWPNKPPTATFSLAISIDDTPHSPPSPLTNVGNDLLLGITPPQPGGDPIDVAITFTVTDSFGHVITYPPIEFKIITPNTGPLVYLFEDSGHSAVDLITTNENISILWDDKPQDVSFEIQVEINTNPDATTTNATNDLQYMSQTIPSITNTGMNIDLELEPRFDVYKEKTTHLTRGLREDSSLLPNTELTLYHITGTTHTSTKVHAVYTPAGYKVPKTNTLEIFHINLPPTSETIFLKKADLILTNENNIATIINHNDEIAITFLGTNTQDVLYTYVTTNGEPHPLNPIGTSFVQIPEERTNSTNQRIDTNLQLSFVPLTNFLSLSLQPQTTPIEVKLSYYTYNSQIAHNTLPKTLRFFLVPPDGGPENTAQISLAEPFLPHTDIATNDLINIDWQMLPADVNAANPIALHIQVYINDSEAHTVPISLTNITNALNTNNLDLMIDENSDRAAFTKVQVYSIAESNNLITRDESPLEFILVDLDKINLSYIDTPTQTDPSQTDGITYSSTLRVNRLAPNHDIFTNTIAGDLKVTYSGTDPLGAPFARDIPALNIDLVLTKGVNLATLPNLPLRLDETVTQLTFTYKEETGNPNSGLKRDIPLSPPLTLKRFATFRASLSNSAMEGPENIAVDSLGNTFVATSNKIYLFNSTNQHVSVFGTPLESEFTSRQDATDVLGQIPSSGIKDLEYFDDKLYVLFKDRIHVFPITTNSSGNPVLNFTNGSVVPTSAMQLEHEPRQITNALKILPSSR